MIYGSFVPVFKSTQYTLKYVVQALTAKDTPTLLVNTLEYGAGGAALGVVLAVMYAWFMERTDVPGKKLLKLLPILPLTLPLLVKGFAYRKQVEADQYQSDYQKNYAVSGSKTGIVEYLDKVVHPRGECEYPSTLPQNEWVIKILNTSNEQEKKSCDYCRCYDWKSHSK